MKGYLDYKVLLKRYKHHYRYGRRCYNFDY
jgi:hypothetical protein